MNIISGNSVVRFRAQSYMKRITTINKIQN